MIIVEIEELEKYRNEHPMDYVKALEVLSKFPDEPNLFNLIYKIIKIHVPETVYKYYSFTNDESLNAMKLDTLANKEVFLSFSNEFNDPYDNKSFFITWT